jgi:hypothetical protein
VTVRDKVSPGGRLIDAEESVKSVEREVIEPDKVSSPVFIIFVATDRDPVLAAVSKATPEKSRVVTALISAILGSG